MIDIFFGSTANYFNPHRRNTRSGNLESLGNGNVL